MLSRTVKQKKCLNVCSQTELFVIMKHDTALYRWNTSQNDTNSLGTVKEQN